VASTTWNPSDKSSGITLSGGNLTATGSGAGGVRSIFSVTTGKWYWEVAFISGAGPGIGAANTTAALATVWTTPTNAAVAYNGAIKVNNVLVSGGVTINTGLTIGVALDVGGGLIWFRSGAAGNWNGSGTANPATGAGGANIAVLGTPLFALAATNGTAQETANFGTSGFVGAVPSGFTGVFGPAAVLAGPRQMLIT
jgi:hypothetical protein